MIIAAEFVETRLRAGDVSARTPKGMTIWQTAERKNILPRSSTAMQTR